MSTYDVAVVGLGAAGAATLYQLARRGIRAVGIDRFSPPHIHGSTHGDTRITREAIGEGEAYTAAGAAVARDLASARSRDRRRSPDAVRRAHPRGSRWRRGRPSSPRVPGEHHRLRESVWDPARGAECRGHQRSASPSSGWTGPSPPTTSRRPALSDPERCVGAQLTEARAPRRGRPPQRARPRRRAVESGVRVRTDQRALDARRVVLAVGPWVRDFLGAERLRLFNVYRQVMTWFQLSPDAGDHTPGAMPVFIWGLQDGNAFYGFPAIDGTREIKVADEKLDTPTTADEASLDVEDGEPRALYDALLRSRLPGLSSRLRPSGALPLHGHAGRELRRRRASGHRRGAPPIAVFGARLQALCGTRRGDRPALDDGVERCRPVALPTRSIRGVPQRRFRPTEARGRTPGSR